MNRVHFKSKTKSEKGVELEIERSEMRRIKGHKREMSCLQRKTEFIGVLESE